jgi:gliding motility-associated-like protein
MRILICFIFFISLGNKAQTQAATFITLSSTGQLEKVTIGTNGCSHSQLSICTITSGSPLSIALFGNTLYVVDNKGFLYSSQLNSSSPCTYLGKFLSNSTKIYGLTVDKIGKVYAANGSQIEVYDPNATNKFSILGSVPTSYQIGGDLLFYLGQIYMSCSNNILLAIDTLNPANSTPFLTFSSSNVFGFASVSAPCSNNKAYALSTAGTTTTIVGVDMTNKVETGAVCTLPYKINDAASVAESGSYSPLIPPTVNSPLSYCQNATATALNAVTTGTLQWYSTASGGTANTVAPIPNTSVVGSTKYYVSQKDAAGCESKRDSILVDITASNPNPTIAITASQSNICLGAMVSFSTTITNGGTNPKYQWSKNGVNIPIAINDTYSSSSLLNNDTISCILTSNEICVSNYIVNSNQIKITNINPINQISNINSCSSFVHSGNTYTSSTVINDTLKSSFGCDSIYRTLNVTIITVNTTTQNISLSHCARVIYSGNTYTNSTIVKDTIKTVLGCDSIYNIATITITPIPTTTQITNISACNSLLYLGNTYNTSMVLRDTIRNSLGCDSIYKIVNININSIATITQTTNLSNCKSITYLGNTYSTSTILKDTLKSYQGCDSIYNITNIIITPIAPITMATNLSSCKGVTYLGVVYNSTTIKRDTLKSNQGCDSIYRVVNIIITPITPSTQTNSMFNCDDIVYSGITYVASITINDTIKSIQGCDSIYRITNIIIKRVNPTLISIPLSSCDSVVYLGNTYKNYIIFTDTTRSFQGCDSIYRITYITIYPKPIIAKPNDVYVLSNTSTPLTINASNSYDYLWYPAIYLDDVTSQFPVCTPINDILYHIKVTTQDGCTDTVSQRVFVSKPLIIPNVFSPNGDGINDFWDITNINTYPQNTVQIFNRYGQLILTSFPGSYKPWNGKLNGNSLPNGVYYYIIITAKNAKPINGSLTILR